MGTAQEVQMKAEQAAVELREVSHFVSAELTEINWLRMWGREVCAKRARVIKQRGDLVRWVRNTENGKSRYLWLPRLRMGCEAVPLE